MSETDAIPGGKTLARERRPKHCEEMCQGRGCKAEATAGAMSHSASEGKEVSESRRHYQAIMELAVQKPKKANERGWKAESIKHCKHVVMLEAIEGFPLAQ